MAIFDRVTRLFGRETPTVEKSIANSATRVLVSTGIGAAVGVGFSQASDSTGQVKDAIGGAILGGIGGAAFLTKTGLKATASALFKTAKAGVKTTPTIAQAALGTANLALRHPGAAIGLGLGAGAVYALATSGPGRTRQDKSYTLSQTGASSTGFSPGMGTDTKQEARNMFMDSTQGLVEGMHRGRHG